MCTYIWWFHREEYSWHHWLPDGGPNAKWYKSIQEGNAKLQFAYAGDWSAVVTEASAFPVARPFIHWRHHSWKACADVHMALGEEGEPLEARGRCRRGGRW